MTYLSKTRVTFLIFLSCCCFAQSQTSRPPAGKVNWTTNPFEHKEFIKNEGQFDDAGKGDKVIYQAILGNIKAYFTADGILYEYDKYSKPTKGDDPDEKKDVKPEQLYLRAKWQGANPQTSISADEELSYYCTYNAEGKGIKANAFKKIIYRNLYPGIDAEFTFPDKKEGMKYSLIVHPGADISKVRLKYSGATVLRKDANGNILVSSPLGRCTDHAPVCFYKDGGDVKMEYTLKGDAESFLVNGQYDKSKTLVIDPLITWTTDPNFTGNDNAYDVDYDYSGNVYVYGCGSPFQLTQLNSSGVIQWQYFSSFFGYYGDFAVDKSTGSSFLVEGFSGSGGANIKKINNQGSLVAQRIVDTNINEMWRAAYNPCQHDIVIAAGGYASNPGQSKQALVVDTSLNLVSAKNVLGVVHGYHDMTLMSLDPSSSIVSYMATATTTGDNLSIADNVLVKVPLPALLPPQYQVADGYKFEEVLSIDYYGGGTSNGMNGMAASPNWLYLYDGATLTRFNKNTGASIGNVTVNVPVIGTNGQILVDWGGLDVDACDHIYAGTQTSIAIYDSSLSPIGTIPLPLTTDTVYDAVLGNKDTLYACGMGFVSSITVAIPACVPPAPNFQILSSSPSYCNQSYVTLTAPAGGTSYLWSGPCITGLNNQQTVNVTCAGSYTVVIGGLSGPPLCANTSLNITIPSDTGAAPLPSFTADTVCYGKPTQFVNTSVPIGGNGVKFYWDFYNSGNYEDSTTNPTWTYPDPGKYFVKLHEVKNGCGADTIIQIVVDTTPPSAIIFFVASCVGQATNFQNLSSDTSLVKYLWTFGDPPSAPNDTSTLTKPSHIYNTAGTYTVTLWPTKSILCHDSAKAVVTVFPLPTINLVNNYVCGDSIITFKDADSAGIAFCEWNIYDTYTLTSYSPAAFGPSTTVVFPDSGTYTIILTVFNAGFCSTTDTSYLTLGKTKASFSINPITACQDSTIQFTDSSFGGPNKWLWNFGDPASIPHDTSTFQNPTHTFSTSGIFNIKLKISGNPGCTDSIVRTITINPAPVVTLNPPNPTICAGDSIALSALGAASYNWIGAGLSCNNCANTKASPATTTTYKVVGTNGFGCTDTATITVTVVNKVVPKITGKDTICVGDSTTLTASAGTFFQWSTGATTSAINVKPGSTTTYQVKVGNGVCTDSIKVTIKVDSLPKGSISGVAKICMGDTIVLTGSGGGKYLWSTGATSSSIKAIASSAADSSFYLIVSNGCIDTTYKKIKIEPVLIITACCDTTITAGDSVKLNASGGNNYMWSPSLGLSCINCPSPFASPTVTTTYFVSATDTDGCKSEANVLVNVTEPCGELIVPNVFTPNGDGKNDQFTINAPGLTQFSIKIYDRWGNEIFYSTNLNIAWDGYTNSGEPVSAGTYFYILKASCKNKSYNMSGFVEVLR
jgi:gliding motility-associated-like protein